MKIHVHRLADDRVDIIRSSRCLRRVKAPSMRCNLEAQSSCNALHQLLRAKKGEASGIEEKEIEAAWMKRYASGEGIR